MQLSGGRDFRQRIKVQRPQGKSMFSMLEEKQRFMWLEQFEKREETGKVREIMGI